MKQAARRPKTAVAEAGVGLLFNEFLQIPTDFHQRLVHQRLGGKVHHVVAQGAAEQEFQREIVDALGLRFFTCSLGFHPAMRDEIAHQTAD